MMGVAGGLGRGDRGLKRERRGDRERIREKESDGDRGKGKKVRNG